MAKPGLLSPLQLTGGQGLLDNTVLTGSSEFNAAAASYTGISFISDLMAAISLAPGAGVEEGTLTALRSLGTDVCPALGNSIPAEFAGQEPFPDVAENGYVGLLQTISEGYLGGGDASKFAQAFAAAQGYCSLANQFILSALDANEYLGPTFTNLDDMITGDFSKVSNNLPVFGDDLANLGFIISLPKLPTLGEPATLLQNLAEQTNSNQLLPCVDLALRSVGLETPDIVNLLTDNRASLFNPNGLTQNQFDRLQQKAYQGLTLVGGDCLDQVLEIFDADIVVDDMADLLDPTKIFPNSFQTLLYQGQPIYGPQGLALGPLSTAPTGCDELGKIIPPDQAVANKALQFELQQVSGIANLTLPQLAILLV